MRLERCRADVERTDGSSTMDIAFFPLCPRVMCRFLSYKRSPPSLAYFPSRSPFCSEFPFLSSRLIMQSPLKRQIDQKML
jgi:hypothetical protein